MISLMLTGCDMSESPSYSQRHSAQGNHSANMSATGNVVFLVTNDNKLELWDTNSYAPLPIWTESVDFPAKITRVALSPAGKYAGVITQNRITTWDIHVNKPVGYWEAPVSPNQFVLSDDGKHALVSTRSKKAYYVDVKKSNIILSLQHSDNISAIDLSEDGQYALIGTYDNAVTLWDLYTGRPIHTWDHSNRITSVAISPNNQHAMAAAHNDKVRIWNTHNGHLEQIVETLPIIVSAAEFSPNNRYLAIGTDPQILYVWDIHDNHLEKQLILPKEAPWKPTAIRIHAVDFSDDSQQVMSEDSRGQYHVWPVISTHNMN